MGTDSEGVGLVSDDVKDLLTRARHHATSYGIDGGSYEFIDRLCDALEAAQQAPTWHLTPPPGWFVFGTHIDSPGPLEFWGEDGGGMPIWERPAQQAPAVDLDELAHALFFAYGHAHMSQALAKARTVLALGVLREGKA